MKSFDTAYIMRATSAFRLLGDPTRFRIISILSREKSGMCVHELADAVGISQSAASHQLAKLESRDVVECYREGQSICYELRTTPFVKTILRAMHVFESQRANMFTRM